MNLFSDFISAVMSTRDSKCKRERVHEDEGNKFLDPEMPTIFIKLKIIPEKIAITAPKERTK